MSPAARSLLLSAVGGVLAMTVYGLWVAPWVERRRAVPQIDARTFT